MERQIKFRGKSLKNKKWVYGDLMSNICGTRIVRYKETDNGAKKRADWEYIDVEPDSVGQFTGLTDCNGKEIYEGDIISLADWIKPCEVIWNNDVASFKIRYIIEDGFCIPKDAFGYWVQDHKDSVCVIGNKFDNPSLLK